MSGTTSGVVVSGSASAGGALVGASYLLSSILICDFILWILLRVHGDN